MISRRRGSLHQWRRLHRRGSALGMIAQLAWLEAASDCALDGDGMVSTRRKGLPRNIGQLEKTTLRTLC